MLCRCIPWILAAEVFPLHVRGNIFLIYRFMIMLYNVSYPVAFATATSNSFYWFFAFSFNLVTPRLVGPPLHVYGYLYITAIFNLIGILLVFLAIPETKV